MERKDISQYFKSIIDQDRCAVVICNLAHEIIYMNKAPVGQSLLDCHNARSCELIEKVVAWFQESPVHNRIYTYQYSRTPAV